MNNEPDKNLPPIDVECFVVWAVTNHDHEKITPKYFGRDTFVFESGGKERCTNLACVSRFEAIKSEAENLREKHINNLISASYPKDEEQDCPSIQIRHAVNMYENGCRMTRELTPEVIDKILNCGKPMNTIEVMEMVAAYVKGELEI